MPNATNAASRRTEPKAARRSQLIEATITSIAKHGIGGTTMSSVTEIAGLSIGIVNFHFKSKQKLFEETLVFLAQEHHEQWFKAYNDAGFSTTDRLLAIVDSHFHPKICTRKKIAVWYAFFGEAGRRSVYRSLVDRIDSERFELSTRQCEEIAAEGGYDCPPPAVIAQTLEGLYDGLWLNILMYPDNFTRETAKAQIRAYLSCVFPDHFPIPDFWALGKYRKPAVSKQAQAGADPVEHTCEDPTA